MIRGLHGLFYSSDPDATRAFCRDQLQLPFTDTGGGWLIFDLAEADMGIHPTGGGHNEPEAGTHDVSFYCDDIAGTIADLRARGVELADAQDHGYGYVTYFKMPGGIDVQLYEPKYQKAGKPAKSAPAKKPVAKKPAAKKPVAKKPAAKAKPKKKR